MSEFCGLWKHEHNQHALVPPKTECGCPSVAEELKAVTYAMEERGGKKCSALVLCGLLFAALHPLVEQCPGYPVE